MKKIFAAFLALAISAPVAIMAKSKEYILATASTGGTFYPVGVALATLSKVKIEPKHGFSLSAISSAGSDENLRLLAKGEAQFALLQGLYGYYAFTGTGPMQAAGAQKNVRSISMLWQNVEHFLIDAKKSKTGTIADYADLKGSRMALGPRNSGTLGSNALLLSAFNIDIYKDYDLVYGGYSLSADALQNSQVSGASIPAGVPAGAVTRLFASVGDQVKLLDITDEQLVKMDGGRELWSRYVIPAGTYVGINRDVNTIAQPNLLAVDESVSEDDVYALTKAIYENLTFLQNIHQATKAMSLQKAIQGLPLPLHPGAAKYYREQGIEIPARLVAQ